MKIVSLLNSDTGQSLNYREVSTWLDDNFINDGHLDGYIYRKSKGTYYVLNDFLIGESINVKWFGAKGDNSTDDTEAFRRCLQFVKATRPPNQLRPSRVFVPRGNYLVESISIDIDGFRMYGEGSGQTMFKFLRGMGDAPAGIYLKNSILDTESPGFQFYKNIAIENIGCDPSTIPNGKSFILIRNAYDFLIRGVDVDTDSFALAPKFALTIADNVYTGSIENCYLPKINCIAQIAWTITTITFINLRSMNVRMTNCLGMTFIQPVIQGKENEKVLVNNCDTVTLMGGDIEDLGIYLYFIGNNSNIRSFGNNILALKGKYIEGLVPENSYFDDKGYIGVGVDNNTGKYGQMAVKSPKIISSFFGSNNSAKIVIGNDSGKMQYIRSWNGVFEIGNTDLVNDTVLMQLAENGDLKIKGVLTNNSI